MIAINSKIFVAGHNGMVGSAIIRNLESTGYTNISTTPKNKCDLRNQKDVEKLISFMMPEIVIIAAAKVGGIVANNDLRAEFIYDNLMIQNNLIHYAHTHNVKKLLFLGSSCIYPRECPQPMKEEYLLTAPLERTNEPYAVAKIAGLKMCESYFRQYGSNFISVMPTNLFGPNDNFDLYSSHVLPALIRKIHTANQNNESSVGVWGTGTPKREFMHVDDCADACVSILETIEASEIYDEGISHINVGTGKDIAISDLVETISEVIGFQGQIEYDRSKPDGPYKKLLDISRLDKMGWKSSIGLKEGIKSTYKWYLENVPTN